MTLTLRERVRLTRIRRQVQRGERDDSGLDLCERARLSFVEWRLQRGLECTCGLSDGECCHCEEFQTNYG